MTTIDAMELLKRICAEQGQAAVAKAIGRSPSTICQILSGDYRGNPDTVLSLVVEVYGGLSVTCPVLGEIPLARCATERKAVDLANPIRVRLFKACPTCRHNPKAGTRDQGPGTGYRERREVKP